MFVCRYIYSGQVMLCVDSVLGLFVLADKYSVTDLKLSCIDYMRGHLVSHCEEHCFAVVWYQYLLACDSLDLQNACLNYIVLNMDVVMCSSHWFCLDCDNLVALLCRSDLIVSSEYALLQVFYLLLLSISHRLRTMIVLKY